MIYQPVLNEFFVLVKNSIKQGTFAKLTLAKTMGDTELKNIFFQLHLDENKKVKFATKMRFKTEETESISSIDEAFDLISIHIKNPFLTALLFTTLNDFTFKVNKKNVGSIITQEPTFKNVSPAMQEMIDKGII